jgi:hypothetical protein
VKLVSSNQQRYFSKVQFFTRGVGKDQKRFNKTHRYTTTEKLSNSKVDQRHLIAPETGDIISKTKAVFVMTEASQPLTTDRD